MTGILARRRGLYLLLVLLMSGCSHQSEKPVSHSGDAQQWWGTTDQTPFDTSASKRQSALKVEGRFIVDEQGRPFGIRGVSIADPDKLVRQKQWRQGLFREIARWGANTVRIPVLPETWRTLGRDRYLALMDQAVNWANEEGMYLILDWHSVGHLKAGAFDHPRYQTDRAETFDFWRTIAARYAEVPTVAVYELFSEPTTAGGAYGQPDWHAWKAFNEDLIDVIRAADNNVIPLVTGFNRAYDLSRVTRHPVERPGIAYAIHPWPQREMPRHTTPEQYVKLWQANWGHIANTYPLLATEIGWVRRGGYAAQAPAIDDGRYGPNIVNFLQARNIGWTVWCFDPDWAPTMIEDWSFSPTEQGAFFRKVMLEEREKLIPAASGTAPPGD